MSVYDTSQAASDMRGIELYAPLGALNRACRRIERLLLDYCANYPQVPTTLQTRMPVYGPLRTESTGAVTSGNLEVQFRIVGTVYPPPGAIIDVVGYDWF